METKNEIIQRAKDFLENAESFVEEYSYHSWNNRHGDCDLAVNVKLYNWPDEDIIEKVIKDYNEDEKAIVKMDFDENYNEFYSGLDAMWFFFLEDQCNYLIEYCQGCCIDSKYYRNEFKKNPNSKTWRKLHLENILENVISETKDCYFAGRSGGWFCFANSNSLNLEEIENLIEEIQDERDYDYQTGLIEDLNMYINQGKDLLKGYKMIVRYVKNSKKNLFDNFNEHLKDQAKMILNDYYMVK